MEMKSSSKKGQPCSFKSKKTGVWIGVVGVVDAEDERIQAPGPKEVCI